MITRIYVDNYKCFREFEYLPGKNQLLLGLNGTGKSSVFDVLDGLRALATEGLAVEEVFPPSSLTRWDSGRLQTFEVNVQRDDTWFEYRVQVEHDPEHERHVVREERLSSGDGRQGQGMALLSRNGNEARLHDEFSDDMDVVLVDGARSTLSMVPSLPDNERLTWFRERLARTLCLRLEPRGMETTSRKELASPDRALASFASWYRHLIQEVGDLQAPLFGQLREVLGPEFAWLKLEREGGNTRALCAGFRPEGGQTASYRFDELSDGQRALIALYTLAAYLRETGQDPEKGVTLCLDEPENYLALEELQPWIMEIADTVSEGSAQVLIASHHPEFIDYYAPADAVRFFREGGGPVRVEPFRSSGDEPLRPSEYVARGWVGE